MNKIFIAAGLAMFLACPAARGQNPPGNASMTTTDHRLETLRGLKIEAGTIASVARDDAPILTLDQKTFDRLPPRTVMKLVLHPAAGSNINVEIWLPDAARWNGCLVGLGNGGAAGHINEAGFIGLMFGGYAAVTTDMGTAPNADSGVGNPEVWKDFGFRATHLMTVAAKQVLQAFYGKGPDYSYFNGGSTGGQQGLQEAQRYPGDYDGIATAISAHCRTPLHAYFLWNYQILAKCPFTEDQEKNVIAAANEYMAARETIPLAAGKFISDPRCDGKDIEAVIALARRKDPTLTPAHEEALRKLLDGPGHAVTGERIFDGVPLGSSFRKAQGNLYLFKWAFGAQKDLKEINFGADIDAYTATLGPYLNAENPDLDAFAARGGKIIMTAGSADSTVPYHASIDYYEKVVQRVGSLEKTRAFFRFYIIPGMDHSGGPGINHPPGLLEALRAWHEKGTAPEALSGQRIVDGKTEFTLPLYPYPDKTGWDAATSSFKSVEGPRGGVEPVASRFLPPAVE